MKRSTINIVSLFFIIALLNIACSNSSNQLNGRYTFKDKNLYIDFTPIDKEHGTFSEGGNYKGTYKISSDKIFMNFQNGDLFGFGKISDDAMQLNMTQFRGKNVDSLYAFTKESTETSSSKVVAQNNSSSTLTKDKVQNALDKALAQLKQGGTATVIGIQENPQENSARADIQYSNFQYDNGTPYVGKQNFTGQGFALLSHYNDGRWVMTHVQLWSIDSKTVSVEVQ